MIDLYLPGPISMCQRAKYLCHGGASMTAMTSLTRRVERKLRLSFFALTLGEKSELNVALLSWMPNEISD